MTLQFKFNNNTNTQMTLHKCTVQIIIPVGFMFWPLYTLRLALKGKILLLQIFFYKFYKIWRLRGTCIAFHRYGYVISFHFNVPTNSRQVRCCLTGKHSSPPLYHNC